MTAETMLAEARRWLGTSGRPNALTRAYAARNGSYYADAPWCDESLTEWARRSGNYAAVCPNGDRAYTVWHAQDFQRIGRWHSGTTANVDAAKPGDIVFFDWGATNNVGAIDHVGIVEVVLGGGRLQTIEGNTGDACLRRVRGASVIAGYGRPDYSGGSSYGGADGGTSATKEDPLLWLKRGDTGEAVKALQEMIRNAGQGAYLDAHGGTDGEYGAGTAEALRRVRASVGSKAGKGYGDQVDGWAYAQLHAAVARVQGKLALKT